jgi:protein LTV1
MAKGKKPFISKKSASTYHLVHRSQRDVGGDVLNEGDTTESGMILWPSSANNQETDEKVLFGGKSTQTMSEWRQKLADAGLLDDEREKYVKEISGTGTFLDATTGHVGNANADSRTQVLEEETLMELDRQFDSIPLSADCMDEDVAGALFGDFDEGDYEELDDDFVMDAAKEPEEGDSGDEGGFNFDEHIKRLMEKAQRERDESAAIGGAERSHWGKKDAEFFSNLKPLHEREEDGEYDEFNDDDSHYPGTTATTPGVVSALSPDEERALCEKFEMTLLEYDSDEVGDDPEEEILGPREIEGDVQLEDALDSFLEERDGGYFMQGGRRYLDSIKAGGSGFSALVGGHMVNAKDFGPDGVQEPLETVEETMAKATARLTLPPARPPAEEIFIDDKSYYTVKMSNPFDCESILSTYSNLDNNPTTIGASRRRKKKNQIAEEPVNKILLSAKTGLPLGVLPGPSNDKRPDWGDNTTIMSVNRGEARKKGETIEEKKARKSGIKQDRQMARITKKVTKELFNEEFQRRSGDVMADDVGGKSVFRYS